ncbi:MULTISPECIES: hypothetical protein [Lysinibacillus]|uniref:hypothetical protein n=1 Tax=Lysinibacillus TaxID=400634 RepID=UPI00083C95C0|nr:MULTISPECIES: hypothetical protein [Lysinibacillus]
MKERDDKDMLEVLKEEKFDTKEKIPKRYDLDSKRIKELVASKETVIVKNGVMQINPSHPDYDFWMED